MIGKLEELTLLAVLRSGDNSLANDVYALVGRGQPGVAFGAVYTTLTRLVKKKLLTEMSVIDEKGRERRGFSITGSGSAALQEAINASASVGGWESEVLYGRPT